MVYEIRQTFQRWCYVYSSREEKIKWTHLQEEFPSIEDI